MSLCVHHPTRSAKAFFWAVRPSIRSSGQILLPRHLVNGLSNLDETYKEYSLSTTDDLIRFWRSNVKVTGGCRAGKDILVDAEALNRAACSWLRILIIIHHFITCHFRGLRHCWRLQNFLVIFCFIVFRQCFLVPWQLGLNAGIKFLFWFGMCWCQWMLVCFCETFWVLLLTDWYCLGGTVVHFLSILTIN